MDDQLSLFDKIRLAREGAAVERCHTHPHLMRYSVGMHTHDLLSLIIFTWMEAHDGELPRAELMVAAQAHDWPERIFGDMPQPTKVLIGAELQAGEMHVEMALDLDYVLTDEEDRWLQVADKVELYLWALEESLGRGNKYFLEWCHDYDTYFEGNPPPAVFTEVMKTAYQKAGERLDFKLLKKVAGL